MLCIANLSEHAQDAHAYRAVARAITASRAQDLAEFLQINIELVGDALALSRRLIFARVVPGSVLREGGKLAGIPVAHARARVRRALIHHIETVTGGAGISAGAAAKACRAL